MPTAEPELGLLLKAFQFTNPDPDVCERFDKAARPILERMAAKNGYGLADDVLDDVVQETFLALANPELKKFNCADATPHQYLLGRVLNAVKTTQIAHGLRRAGSDFDAEAQRQFVPIDDDLNLASTRGVNVNAIHDGHTVQKIFAKVDPGVLKACLRVYGEDESQVAVAAEMKISRFALSRQISAATAIAVQMLVAA